jgi:subtilase family serine protease
MRIVKSLLPALLLAGLFSSLSYAVTPDRISGLIDSSQAIPLAKSLHPRVQAEFDRGVVEPSFKLSYMTLLTKPSAAQQRELNQLLAAQQNPKSPLYHKWITPAQYADRFGLSPNDINRITDWLKSQGFVVLSVGGGRNSVIFSGTAAQVQGAFKAEIHRYNVDGEEHIANSTAVMIPGALNGVVTGIRGLHDFRMQATNRTRSPRLQHYGLSSEFVDLNFLFPNFLSPADVATIYDINPLYNATTPIDGTGQKIAIMGQTDIFLADINDFRTGFGLTPISGCTLTTTGITGMITVCNTSNFQYVLVGADPSPAPQADIGEADLDVEWSGAVAPHAQIIFVNAPNTAQGVGDSLAAAINPPSGPPLAPVISMSYGICEAFSGDQETELTQANAEGVTVVMSSGDAGAATCDRNPPGGVNATPPFSPAVFGLAVSYPASSPEVTAVGGTAISTANDSNPPPSQYWSSTMGINGSTALQYIPEVPWNDNAALGQYCAANPSISFCNPGSPGVVITNAATFQQDYWISIAGGGASNCYSENISGVCLAGFPQPTWQQGLTVSGAPAGVRWVPDVSLFASPNLPGYVFCTPQDPGSAVYTSTCVSGLFDAVDSFQSVVGGTSVSTPVFAGMVALLNQYLGGSSTSGLGNINPKLYELATDSSNHAFHRVTTGDNKVTCASGQPSNQTVVPSIKCPTTGTLVVGYSASNADATTGYNLVTGLGSVDANNLALAWLASEVSFTTGATTLTPASVAAGDSATSTVTITPLNTIATTATYNFSCSGLPVGATCSFTPISVTGPTYSTTLTISTLANAATGGPTTITVTGTSGGVTNSATVSLTVTATNQSFTLAPGAATYSVTQGQSVSNATVTLTGTNGFNTPVTYTCTDPASESRCTATTTSTGANFVITTTAPAAAANQSGHSTRIFYAALLPGLLGIMFTVGSRKRSLRGMRLLGLIVALGFSTMWLASCGGSGGGGGGTKDPGTPTGPYTITINATTGGTNPVTATTTFILQVN